MIKHGTEPKTYEIRIRGQLGVRVVSALGATRSEDSDTSILVDAQDRAALHSTINRLQDFALELVSVTPVAKH